ncbi:MAG: YbaB/EbfC family nucleoid-associated protein [Ruminococcaceae bacterium]|nr:YbaB/EbfC family nucleoid-associated protein [Oscillospiraceae bacterium]
MKARIPKQNQDMNQAAMMKQLQQMQDNMQTTQKEIEESEFSASSGGGAVEVVVNGSHEMKSIKIQPDVVDPEDVEMLEDMVIAATNEAMRKATETMEREMSKITGGMNIPGLGGLI